MRFRIYKNSWSWDATERGCTEHQSCLQAAPSIDWGRPAHFYTVQNLQITVYSLQFTVNIDPAATTTCKKWTSHRKPNRKYKVTKQVSCDEKKQMLYRDKNEILIQRIPITGEN